MYLCIGLTLVDIDFDQKDWLDLVKEVEEWDTRDFYQVSQKVKNEYMAPVTESKSVRYGEFSPGASTLPL